MFVEFIDCLKANCIDARNLAFLVYIIIYIRALIPSISLDSEIIKSEFIFFLFRQLAGILVM